MTQISSVRRPGSRFLLALAALAAFTLILAPATSLAQLPITKLSTDTFSNTTSAHATEVEPSTYANGNTIVTAFQIGRFTDGGSSDIGFSTSTNGGSTWTFGNLPGITKLEGSGIYDRASDPSVTYNAKFKKWLVSTLGIYSSPSVYGAAVLVSSSSDGIKWNNPATVATTTQYFDKNWIACDNNASSPYYGNCYSEWDNFDQGDTLYMSKSTDGGTTWSAAVKTANSAAGNGAVFLIQPSGKVIAVTGDAFRTNVLAYTSSDGGTTWSKTSTVTSISDHAPAGGIRALPLLTAGMDSSGKVYVVWQDCRFSSGCLKNDLVMTTTTDGSTWTPVARIPIDPQSSAVDHFTPGLAIAPGTSGATAKLNLTYYYYPATNCKATTCQLYVGYVNSTTGGATWTRGKAVTGPMTVTWLPPTTQGNMAADFLSGAYAGGRAHGVFAAANANVGNTYDEAMFSEATGVADEPNQPTFSSRNDKPVKHPHSDHPRYPLAKD